jgi:hypothetical protein
MREKFCSLAARGDDRFSLASGAAAASCVSGDRARICVGVAPIGDQRCMASPLVFLKFAVEYAAVGSFAARVVAGILVALGGATSEDRT